MLDELKDILYKLASEERRIKSIRYFKTAKGEYGEGDTFIGIKIPDIRKAIKHFTFKLSLKDIEQLLHCKEHEFRLAALIIMVKRYQKLEDERELVVELYISNTDYINNWDLVDSTAHYILGPWLESRDRTLLYEFANTHNLWKQRIAIMSTFHYIKKNRDFKDALAISEILLNHKHDLIHKAVGWMLREIGNISISSEEEFLKKHYKNMPRTMLRYAIEKFPVDKRQNYLKGTI
ncbi:MAG: DNA alkylation repair protein [Spirochaetaceae bacterium]